MESRELITCVRGMFCPRCPEIIAENLLQTRGVIDADVRLLRAELTVRYDPEIVTEAALRETLSQIGYPACERGAPGSNPIVNALLRPFRGGK